jgi:uncharacterized NAD(P)/FAD-binding protein YdhS
MLIPPHAPPRIVIIGGGFSGAVVALNLLNRLRRGCASIVIIEPRPTLGAGLAYSAADPAHRVNVPASRLLVLAEAPGAFEAWFRDSGASAQDPEALLEDGRAYPRRAVFGGYVDGLLRDAIGAPDAPAFAHIKCRAVRAISSGGQYLVDLETGETVVGDVLVLAVSHPSPSVPGPFRPLAEHAKFIADPWVPNALGVISQHDRVLIIGTALSTADVIASLKDSGHIGKIVAISRRGLVSRLRKMQQKEIFGDFASKPSRTALALLRAVRGTVAKAEASGSSWGAVMDAARAQGLTIWTALPPAEKRRFLRHVRPFWDVHRYQVAPQLAAITDAQCAAGKLAIRAARLQMADFRDDKFHVRLKYREASAPETEVFDAVVNCTGPAHGTVMETNPVLASLGAAGLLRADPYGLGVDTDFSARVLGSDGQAIPDIFVAGPLARAAFGELMGLPQVSEHAALVASKVADLVAESDTAAAVRRA